MSHGSGFARPAGAGIAVVTALLLAAPAPAEIASALIREDEDMPGTPGENVDSINNSAVNQVGGYAFTVNTSGSGTTLGNIWGNATGGPGAVIITEGMYGIYLQTSFESFFGLDDFGSVGYSPSTVDTVSGTTGLDAAWVDITPVLVEEFPVPTLPGFFSTFNSRVGITPDGHPYWIGGITDTQGGSTQSRVLFFDFSLEPLLKAGDSIGGVAEPVDTGSGIDFDARLITTTMGVNYITLVQVDAPSSSDGVMVINGDAIFAGGAVMREASPVPMAIGGLAGENWDNFDYLGITRSGAYMVTGDTDASTSEDEFICINGEIILREGMMVSGDAGTFPLSGSIEGAYFNENQDWCAIWDVNTPDNLEALLLNGEILLLEGDPVDWNGDGVIDAGDDDGVIANFTGISSITMGPRDGVDVEIYFTADIDFEGTSSSSDDLEGGFRLVAAAAEGIPAFVDIRTGACPNPFNRAGRGVLPINVLGTEDFDVTMIDLSTMLLSRADGVGGSVSPNEGPPGPHSVFSDTGTPFEGEACDCIHAGADGIMDLRMKFRTDDMVAGLMLDDLPFDDLELVVTGSLLDGTPFFGSDCVRIVPPGSSNLMVESSWSDLYVQVDTPDLNLDDDGYAPFGRWYSDGTMVHLTAPPNPDRTRRLSLTWFIDGQPYSQASTIAVQVGTVSRIEAMYLPRPSTDPWVNLANELSDLGR